MKMKIKKAEFQEALQFKGLPTMGKAIDLKQCLSDSLQELTHQNMTSDHDKSIYMYTVNISSDGVAMKGKLTLL